MSQTLPPDPTAYYSRVVESYAHFFDRPEVRLRFLKSTLAQQAALRAALDEKLTRLEFIKKTYLYDQLLKVWLYHLIFRETRRLLPSVSWRGHGLLSLRSRAPLTARIFFKCYQFRTAFFAVSAALLAVIVFGVYRAAAWSARYVNTQLTERYGTASGPAGATATQDHVFTQVAAASLPDYSPEKVWLVEEKDHYERYSNGARILNDYATETRPRSYYIFKPGGEREPEANSKPVGIVYHTSESHLVPFNEGNSESIETRTRGLVEYVRKNSSYNYVIDRFGQIYRVVRDEDAANHAGNSVWADARGVYVGLNESFLGVCFETTMSADASGERLTEAQLVSGRLLTQVLRSRFQIDDANCVTHGLVSVNPSNMRVCFHHDWARDFPFSAMGLSDKYLVAPASVSEFGFTYDEETLGKLGGRMWPGVAQAEQEFERKAGQAKLKTEEMRQRGREQYRRQFDSQRALRAEE